MSAGIFEQNRTVPLTTSKNHNGEPTDDCLIKHLQSRRNECKTLFGQLVARHQSALYGRCLAYLRHPEDAADASQETLLRAYRAIDSFKGEAAFRTWLFAIADNQCHTLARKRARGRVDKHIESLVRVDQEVREQPPENGSICLDLIHGALLQIPQNGRDVLQLRYFADLSIEEIAATLGLGISAAKMRLYRAQDQIARLIDENAFTRAA